MNNIEQNALRIAELMGWDTVNEGEYWTDLYKEIYADYRYLMPIVFECNGTKGFYYYKINLNENNCDYVSIRMYCDSQEIDSIVAKYEYNTNSEPEFIEAIQLAVIKYLGLKDE